MARLDGLGAAGPGLLRRGRFGLSELLTGLLSGLPSGPPGIRGSPGRRERSLRTCVRLSGAALGKQGISAWRQVPFTVMMMLLLSKRCMKPSTGTQILQSLSKQTCAVSKEGYCIVLVSRWGAHWRRPLPAALALPGRVGAFEGGQPSRLIWLPQLSFPWLPAASHS